ncbi:MAG: hypothetical protein KJ040_05430 [Gammaproteobacteria bacterium]|nr:hypothetical protein [Gammaproteobacteria bacterium]
MNQRSSRRTNSRCCGPLLAAALGMAVPLLATGQVDHSQHAAGDEHAGHDTGRDELGRRLYGMKHEMSPELTAELRQKIPLFAKYTDAQMNLSMEQMGADYSWYISPADLKAEQGVLILLHGFREQGDKLFRERVQPIGDVLPTSLGVGMAMMMSEHIQLGLDDLQAAGAKEIVVVPIVSSTHDEMYRQWEYVLGRRAEASYATVGQVKTDAVLHLTAPPGTDPLIAEILLDYALEISTDPKNEVVIIASHGPAGAADNARLLDNLEMLAKYIQEDGGFAAVRAATLQDDAVPEVRAANVQKLRAMVEGATKDGKKALIVTNLVGARTIQAKLRRDLKGLDYAFNAKGIVQHDNFIKWISESVHSALEKSAYKPASATH